MTINSLIIDGFKSFRDRTEVMLGDLTILSGANSSGKSTIMQAVLLMKQTLESGYDPGPLLISGPNVIFSHTDQMFWTAPGSKQEQICIGLMVNGKQHINGYDVTLERQKDGTTPLKIIKATSISDSKKIEILPVLTESQKNRFREEIQKQRQFSDKAFIVDPYIQRERFFLNINLALRDPNTGNIMLDLEKGFFYNGENPEKIVEEALRSIIHVPGLRGNPRRTYPVTAVEKHFPGLFPDYVASVIAFWQNSSKEKSKQLSSDLKELGLTWNVKARKTSDTEVEIQVARLPKSIQHGARDMVSIADVGFGMSQSSQLLWPYLQQNPVNWYTWNNQKFIFTQELNMVFLA